MGAVKRRGITGIRLKLQRASREYRAILVLTNAVPLVERREIDRSLERIPQMSAKLAKLNLGRLERELRRVRDHYGVRVELADLELYARPDRASPLRDWDNKTPGGSEPLVFFPKHLLAEIFDHYERAFPDFLNVPPHARIGLDLYGVRSERTTEIYLLEATLFEDMAALFNATVDKWIELEATPRPPKLGQKVLESLMRATAKAAFNLLEGYINGVGFDVVLSRETSQDEREVLLEWDEGRSRPRTLSIREKLLKYPRLALKLTHPPIDENRSTALAVVLDLEQRVRHSLIHPTPRSERGIADYDREFEFRAFRRDQLEGLCDSVIEVIAEVDHLLDGKFGRATHWLFRRELNGRFSEKAFF